MTKNEDVKVHGNLGANLLMQSMLTSVVIGGYEADQSLPKQVTFAVCHSIQVHSL